MATSDTASMAARRCGRLHRSRQSEAVAAGRAHTIIHDPSTVGIGRRNDLFAGSIAGGRAAATAYTLVETAKLRGADPEVVCRSPHRM